MLAPAYSYAADCTQPVTTIYADEAAKCDGFLFSRAKEQEVRAKIDAFTQRNQEFDLSTQENVFLRKEIKDLHVAITDEQQKSKDWQKEAVTYTKKYEALESSRTTRDLIFFGLGVGLTVVGGVGIIILVGHASTLAIVAVAVPK